MHQRLIRTEAQRCGSLGAQSQNSELSFSVTHFSTDFEQLLLALDAGHFSPELKARRSSRSCQARGRGPPCAWPSSSSTGGVAGGGCWANGLTDLTSVAGVGNIHEPHAGVHVTKISTERQTQALQRNGDTVSLLRFRYVDPDRRDRGNSRQHTKRKSRQKFLSCTRRECRRSRTTRPRL